MDLCEADVDRGFVLGCRTWAVADENSPSGPAFKPRHRLPPIEEEMSKIDSEGVAGGVPDVEDSKMAVKPRQLPSMPKKPPDGSEGNMALAAVMELRKFLKHELDDLRLRMEQVESKLGAASGIGQLCRQLEQQVADLRRREEEQQERLTKAVSMRFDLEREVRLRASGEVEAPQEMTASSGTAADAPCALAASTTPGAKVRSTTPRARSQITSVTTSDGGTQSASVGVDQAALVRRAGADGGGSPAGKATPAQWESVHGLDAIQLTVADAATPAPPSSPALHPTLSRLVAGSLPTSPYPELDLAEELAQLKAPTPPSSLDLRRAPPLTPRTPTQSPIGALHSMLPSSSVVQSAQLRVSTFSPSAVRITSRGSSPQSPRTAHTHCSPPPGWNRGTASVPSPPPVAPQPAQHQIRRTIGSPLERAELGIVNALGAVQPMGHSRPLAAVTCRAKNTPSIQRVASFVPSASPRSSVAASVVSRLRSNSNGSPVQCGATSTQILFTPKPNLALAAGHLHSSPVRVVPPQAPCLSPKHQHNHIADAD